MQSFSSRPGSAAAWRPATSSRPPTRTAADQRSSMITPRPPFSSREAAYSPAAHQEFDERQETLIWLTLATLTNLAEGADVAPRMLARGVVPVLAWLLPNSNSNVEQLAVTLLLRLSMLDQAPADIMVAGVVPRLVHMVADGGHQTAELALRLLHNLSFHEKGRAAMVSAGAISKVVIPSNIPGTHCSLTCQLNSLEINDWRPCIICSRYCQALHVADTCIGHSTGTHDLTRAEVNASLCLAGCKSTAEASRGMGSAVPSVHGGCAQAAVHGSAASHIRTLCTHRGSQDCPRAPCPGC